MSPDVNGRYSKEQSLELLERFQSMRLGPSDDDYGSLEQSTVHQWRDNLLSELRNKDIDTPSKLFFELCQFIASHENKPYVVEKTPHHLNWIKRIKDYYPSAKFIVMLREPYGVMRSYKNQGSQRNSEVRKVHKKQYHPIQAALVWRGYSRSVLNIQNDYSKDVFIIKNEDLSDNSVSILRAVADFLGLPRDEKFAEKLPARANSSVNNDDSLTLDSADYFWLHLIAGSEIRKMGYELREVPLSLVAVIWSFFKIPLWCIRTIILLKGNSKANVFKYLWRWIK